MRAYGVDAYPDAVSSLAAGGERQIVTRLDLVDEVYADGPDSGTIYISGDSSIVTVDENGLIRGVGEGVTTITVIHGFGEDRIEVRVDAPMVGDTQVIDRKSTRLNSSH